MVKGYSVMEANIAHLDYRGLILGLLDLEYLKGTERTVKLDYLEGIFEKLHSNLRQIDSSRLVGKYVFDFDRVGGLIRGLRSGKSLDEQVLKDILDKIPQPLNAS